MCFDPPHFRAGANFGVLVFFCGVDYVGVYVDVDYLRDVVAGGFAWVC